MCINSFCELCRLRQVNLLTRPLQVGPGDRDALDNQTVARVACGTQQRAVAGVLYKRATAAVTTATESTAVNTAREREREQARRWEASCGGRGGVEIPFSSELHVFLKLPRHLADAEPSACGHACLRLSVVSGGR